MALKAAKRVRKCFQLLARCGLIAAVTVPPVSRATAQLPVADMAAGVTLTAYPGGKWQPGPAQYGSTIVENVPVAMDDGVVLRATIAYPTNLASGKRAGGSFPVIIEHTPYVRTPNDPSKQKLPITYLTERGYIYVVVQARGTGASSGEINQFGPRDAQDGKAIVDWASHRLPGSDGRIGLLGCSWPGGLAITTAATVGANSPVKAVVAPCAGLMVARQTMLIGGLQTTRMATFVSGLTPAVGGSPAATAGMARIADQIAEGGDAAYDRDYWSTRRPTSHAQKIVDNGIPVLLWAGWRDFVEIGAVRAYTSLQNAYGKRPIDSPMIPGQEVTSRYQLIVGDWKHGEGLDVGIFLQWMETWLKGVDTGIQTTKTPMHLWEKGTGRWVNLAGFPAVPDYTPLYLGTRGALGRDAGGSAADRLRWETPDQQDARLVFTTSPFQDGATLSGPISTTIYAQSSNTNLELIARLLDVAPEGSAVEITSGVILGSQSATDSARNWTDRRGRIIWPWQTMKRDVYLTPGKVYDLEIAMAPRQWAVRPGHKLRLELTTQSPLSVCPRKGLPPIAGSDVCGLTKPQLNSVPGGVYRILRGGRWPSRINLPMLPYKALAEVRSGVTPTAWAYPGRISNPAAGDKVFALPLDWGDGR